MDGRDKDIWRELKLGSTPIYLHLPAHRYRIIKDLPFRLDRFQKNILYLLARRFQLLQTSGSGSVWI